MTAATTGGAPRPVDLDDRAIGVARILDAEITERVYAAAAYAPLASWAHARCTATFDVAADAVTVLCGARGFAVEWRFAEDGTVGARYRWRANACPHGSRFAPELSLAAPMQLDADAALDTWRYRIETVTRFENGVERVDQGESVTPLFDARRGEAAFTLRPMR